MGITCPSEFPSFVYRQDGCELSYIVWAIIPRERPFVKNGRKRIFKIILMELIFSFISANMGLSFTTIEGIPMNHQTKSSKPGKYLKSPLPRRPGFLTVLLCLLLAAALLCFFAARWYVSTYGDTGFDSILYTLSSDLGGLQSGLIVSFCLKALLPAVLGWVALGALLFFPSPKLRLQVGALRLYPLRRWAARATALVLSLVLTLQAAVSTGLPEYIYGIFNESELFETYYVDPGETDITFPEQKRNLIYIYLESMEITYLSKALGGASEEKLIPELYDLARENVNFSHNADVGGFLPVPGATWTIGAMVAHTAGVPLKLPSDVAENEYGQDDAGFLPGIVSLQDVLAEAGYYQTLMVGSVASFGGRRQYYLQHGADYVYDISTARRDDIVADDYFVWWGMEDKYLMEYAKQELTEISQKDQPFAFTMLTVDTHHIGGYVCEYCREQHEEQYANVMSCSSRQVADFVAWIRQQPFYENTTIIITGDHLSMDNGYFERTMDSSYTRRNYNCFINAAADTRYSKNRKFSALDMFPTTLAALGCQIPGERLGLGVNLFSGQPTLIEKLGYAKFDRQLTMASEYYAVNFRLEEPSQEE